MQCYCVMGNVAGSLLRAGAYFSTTRVCTMCAVGCGSKSTQLVSYWNGRVGAGLALCECCVHVVVAVNVSAANAGIALHHGCV